jgi:hypothetical protein
MLNAILLSSGLSALIVLGGWVLFVRYARRLPPGIRRYFIQEFRPAKGTIYYRIAKWCRTLAYIVVVLLLVDVIYQTFTKSSVSDRMSDNLKKTRMVFANKDPGDLDLYDAYSAKVTEMTARYQKGEITQQQALTGLKDETDELRAKILQRNPTASTPNFP